MKSSKVKKDEVRDEQGRQRFHGAFTGGFSAGYYNTVGSKEGWTPSTFQSSRNNRAQARQQRPEDFMDEDDGLLGKDLEAQLPYDTLGEVSRKLAREQAEKEAAGAAVPGIVVDELIAPSHESIGKRLLQMMGWREGLGVGSRLVRKRARPGDKAGGAGRGGAEDEEEEDDDLMPWAEGLLPAHLKAREDVVQQGRITFARRNDVSVELPVPKNNLHGLGFDPMRDAPEFAALRMDAQGGDDDDRGVYRMADVMGKNRGTSSRAGRRDATGFALDEDEDDVYDGDMGGPSTARYNMDISSGLPGQDEDDDLLHRHSAKAKRRALDEWIGDSGGGGKKAEPARSRVCATDGRAVPPGFELAVSGGTGFKKDYWAPPDPPRDFKPYHRFEADDAEHKAALAKQKDQRGQLSASSRGQLLGESKPPAMEVGGKTVSSVFDLMSEEDRQRILGGGGAAPPTTAAQQQQPPAAPLAQGQVFVGMQSALAKRFSVVESTVLKSDLPAHGLIQPVPASERAKAPAPAPAPATTRPSKPFRDPTRSQALWYPAALLCKRFNVPVPLHAKGAPQAPPPRPVTVEVRSDERFQQEIGAFLPGAGALFSQQQQQEAEAALPTEEVAMEDENAALEEREVELPSFEEKERPPIDFFKAIFEEDEDDEESDEEEEEEEQAAAAGKQPAVAAAAQQAGGAAAGETAAAPRRVMRSPLGPQLAGDAPTPPRISPPRDSFLQQAPAAEEILGPVMIRKKQRTAERRDDEDEDDEEDGGLNLFSAAASKKRRRAEGGAAPATQKVKQHEGGGGKPSGSEAGGDSSSDSSSSGDEEEGAEERSREKRKEEQHKRKKKKHKKKEHKREHKKKDKKKHKHHKRHKSSSSRHS